MCKSILILVDGMRPDSMLKCGNEYVQELLASSYNTLNAKTVMPSVTLPCHMSLFHSVPPQRHGTLTNTYTPQVRPIKGLFEILKDKRCASFYNWEELRDISRPGALHRSVYMSYSDPNDRKTADTRLTAEMIKYTVEYSPDFVFLYLGVTDADGHDFGWMGKEYLTAVYNSIECIKSVIKQFANDYTIIVTADHGGHDRIHGTDCSEDMEIPLIIYPCDDMEFDTYNSSIMDIAPTVTHLLGIAPAKEWEGSSLLK